MATKYITTKLVISGESEYKAKLRDINQEYSKLDASMKLVQAQFQNQQNSLKALTVKGNVYNQMQDQQREKIKLIEEALKNAQTATGTYAQKSEELTAAISANEAALEELKNAGGDTADEQKKLTEEIARQKKELEDNERYLQKSEQGVSAWEKELIKAQTAEYKLNAEVERNNEFLEEAKNSTDGAATSIDRFGREVREATSDSQKFGEGTVQAVDAIAAAIVASGVKQSIQEIRAALLDSLDASMEFESAMAGVNKTTDLTAEELKAMGDQFKELATTIPVLTTELAKYGELGGQLGVVKDALVDFSQTVAMMTTATDLSGESAATMLAQLKSISGFDDSMYSNVSSAIVDLGNSSATTESKILEMTLGIAASAKLANMSVADQLALSAAVTSLGIETANGSTQMSKLISTMQSAVETGDQLEEFASIAGMSAQEFATAWGTDAAGSLDTFIQGLNDTERNGKSANVALTELGITETRMQRMILSLASSGDLLNRSLDQSGRAFAENSALTDEAAKRYETLESKQTMFANSSNNLKIAIGDTLNPAMERLYEIGSDVNEWAAEFIEQNPWVIRTVVALTSAIAALALAFAGFTIIDKLIPMIKDFVAALAANPYLLAAVAIITVITAIVAFAATAEKAELAADKYSDTVDNLNDSINDSKTAHEDATKAIEDQIVATNQLTASLEHLIAKENQSAADRQMINDIVTQLNETVPGLALAYNEEANALNMSSQALKAYVQNQAEMSRRAADITKLTENYVDLQVAQENLTAVSDELAEAERVLAEEQKKYADGTELSIKAMSDAQDEVDALKEKEVELTEILAGVTEEVTALEEAMGLTAEALTSTTEQSGDAIAAFEQINSSLAALETAYLAAYQSAYESIDGQIGLFDKMDGKAKQSIGDLNAALDSQIVFMQQYAENLRLAVELGVDQGLVQTLSDGSEESAQILAAIVAGGETEIAALNEKLGQVEEGKQAFASTVAEMETDFSNSMAEIESRLDETVKEMDMADEMAVSARNSVQGYINAIKEMVGQVEDTMYGLAKSGHAAFARGQEERSPARAFYRSGVNAIKGDIQGAKSMEEELDRTYEEIARNKAKSYDIEMNPSNYITTNNDNSTTTKTVSPTFILQGFDETTMSKIIDIIDRGLGDRI